MDRRTTTRGGPGAGGRWGTARRATLLLGAGLLLAPGAAVSQERPRTEECRCVDADGNPIESCTCFRRPDADAFVRTWSLTLPNRARIGVTVSTEQHPRYDRDGAHVQDVLEGGPADEAGLREGDVIVRVDGRSLFDALEDPGDEDRLDLDRSAPVQRLLSILGDLEPGDEVEVEYLRDGETRTTVIEAEENPARFGGISVFGGDRGRWRFGEEGSRGFVMPREGRVLAFADSFVSLRLDSLSSFEGGDFRAFLGGGADPCFRRSEGSSASVYVFGSNCVDGLELTALNPELGEYFGAEEGLLVTEVREGTTLGLEPGDVLLAVGDREVDDVADARRILRSCEPDEDVTLRIVRRGETMEVTGRRR